MTGGSVRARPVAIGAALVVALTGCGSDEARTTATCDNAAFRAQEEELYVTQATISNALAGGGAPATLLLDLRRARRALGAHLDAHPPCDGSLRDVEATERDALAFLDDAIGDLDEGRVAAGRLRAALAELRAAERRLHS